MTTFQAIRWYYRIYRASYGRFKAACYAVADAIRPVPF
jgi:hypothetical protein